MVLALLVLLLLLLAPTLKQKAGIGLLLRIMFVTLCYVTITVARQYGSKQGYSGNKYEFHWPRTKAVLRKHSEVIPAMAMAAVPALRQETLVLASCRSLSRHSPERT